MIKAIIAFLPIFISCAYLRVSYHTGMYPGSEYQISKSDSTIAKIQIASVNSKYWYYYKGSEPAPNILLDSITPDSLSIKSKGKYKGLNLWHSTIRIPIRDFDFQSKDTNVLIVLNSYPTLVPESDFGEMVLRIKRDGITEIIAKRKSDKEDIRTIPISINNNKISIGPCFWTKSVHKTKKVLYFWENFKQNSF